MHLLHVGCTSLLDITRRSQHSDGNSWNATEQQSHKACGTHVGFQAVRMVQIRSMFNNR